VFGCVVIPAVILFLLHVELGFLEGEPSRLLSYVLSSSPSSSHHEHFPGIHEEKHLSCSLSRDDKRKLFTWRVTGETIRQESCEWMSSCLLRKKSCLPCPLSMNKSSVSSIPSASFSCFNVRGRMSSSRRKGSWGFNFSWGSVILMIKKYLYSIVV